MHHDPRSLVADIDQYLGLDVRVGVIEESVKEYSLNFDSDDLKI
jgi:hypothetical protein